MFCPRCHPLAPTPVDQTKNVGSIKAYQLQRAQARLAGTVMDEEEDEFGDEDMDGDYGGGSGGRKSGCCQLYVNF